MIIKNIMRSMIIVMVLNLNMWGAGSSLEIEDSTITEGDSGGSEMVFEVNHSIRAKSPVEIYYTTINGTAKGGKDYVVSSGTVVIAPNESSTKIIVPIIHDTKYTSDKKIFTVSIASATTVSRAIATGTIIDNDPIPTKNTLIKGGHYETVK